MNRPEPKPWIDEALDPSKAARRAHFLFRVAAAFTLPYRRMGGGRSSPGAAGAVAILLLYLFAVEAQDLACLYYAYASTVGLVLYAIGRKRGVSSRYEGRPWLLLLVRNEALASALEPLAVLAMGCWLSRGLPCLALVILASGVGCAAGEITEWHQRRKLIIEFEDAQHDLEYQRSLYQRGR